jgi:hypothetical protein
MKIEYVITRRENAIKYLKPSIKNGINRVRPDNKKIKNQKICSLFRFPFPDSPEALLIFDLRRDANGTFALMRKVIPRNVMKVVPENSCPDSHGLVIRPANNAARKDEPNTAHDPYSLTIGTFMCSII